jgi:hypothetical protein
MRYELLEQIRAGTTQAGTMNVDFSHTVTNEIILPPGVSFTAAGGFLSQAPPTTTSSTTQPSVTTTTTIACQTARCTLAAAVHGAACAGQTIPGNVTTKLDQAIGLIESAESATAKKRTRLLTRAKTKLALATKAARKDAKGKKPKLTAACAADLEGAADGVRSRLGS